MDSGFGKYDVYAVAGSIYCYRDTNVLKNHFGLRDSTIGVRYNQFSGFSCLRTQNLGVGKASYISSTGTTLLRHKPRFYPTLRIRYP